MDATELLYLEYVMGAMALFAIVLFYVSRVANK
jgi:hypothetical protein